MLLSRTANGYSNGSGAAIGFTLELLESVMSEAEAIEWAVIIIVFFVIALPLVIWLAVAVSNCQDAPKTKLKKPWERPE